MKLSRSTKRLAAVILACLICLSNIPLTYAQAASSETVEVKSELCVTMQPQNVIGEAGTIGTTEVAASGDELDYQWYFRAVNKTSWTASGYASAKSSKLEVPINSTTLQRVFKCVITDKDGNSVETREVSVIQGTKLEITVQPDNITGEIGTTKSSTVVAEGNGLTYQWYFRAVNKTSWTASGYASAKSAKLEVPINSTTLQRVFKCIITDKSGNIIETREITVAEATAQTITITEQPEDIVGQIGGFGLTEVFADGEELNYKWYFRPINKTGWSESGYASARPSVLEIPINSSTLQRVYKCVITDKNGNSVETREVSVVEGIRFAITIQPEDIKGEIGTTGTTEVIASGADLSYQWYFRAVNKTSWTASGYASAKSSKLEVPINSTTLQRVFKCIITDKDGKTIETREVSISEGEADNLEIIQQPSDIIGEIGTVGTAEVEATGSGLSYQWYFRAVNKNSWTASGYASANRSKIEVPINSTTLQRVFKCVITDKYGNTVETNEVAVSEFETPKLYIITQPEDITGEKGTTQITEVIASGTELNYQWYFRGINKTGWNTSGYSSANSSKLEVPINSTTLQRVFKCVITDKDGNSVETREVFVSEYIKEQLEITTQPSVVTIDFNTPATFSIKATGSNITYAWYVNETAVEGAEDLTLSVNDLASIINIDDAFFSGATASVYCIVSDGSASITSDKATLTINPCDHEKKYEPNDETTHTISCSTCDYSVTDSCNGDDIKHTDTNMHSYTCSLCGQFQSECGCYDEDEDGICDVCKTEIFIPLEFVNGSEHHFEVKGFV